MKKNKRWIHEEFERNMLRTPMAFKNAVIGAISDASIQEEAAEMAQSIPRQLMLYTAKLIIAMLLLCVFLIAATNRLEDSVNKNKVRKWVSLSTSKHGLVYTAIEAIGRPDMAFALAKYFKKIGEPTSSVELTKLAIELNEIKSPEKRLEVYKDFLSSVDRK